MNLDEYYHAHVEPCRDCGQVTELDGYITYRKLPPFMGTSSPKVMLLGHSPRVRTNTEIDVTLDLNNERNLTRYISTEVLAPLRISMKLCAATNAVKCLTTAIPEEISDRFVQRAFEFCCRHLASEVSCAEIALLISFSERVSDMLQVLSHPEAEPEPMKRIFATLRTIDLGEKAVAWIPVVHIPKAKVRAHYFPEQTRRLQSLSPEVARLLA